MALIRPARLDDCAALARLKLETFRETFLEGFCVPYPPDDLAVFEAQAYGEPTIAAELANPDLAQWVVEEGGALLGFAKVGPCHLPHPEVRPEHGELYQVYLRRSAQGAGIGGRLLAIALDHLRAVRPGPQWLGVWSLNHRAQAVYARLGFRKVGEYQFPVGNWRDDEYILRRD